MPAESCLYLDVERGVVPIDNRRRLFYSPSLLPLHVPVVDLGFVARSGKVVANVVGDHYRAVLSAGAPEGDGQVALPFTDVMWQQVDEQVGNSRNKFDGLRKRTDI